MSYTYSTGDVSDERAGLSIHVHNIVLMKEILTILGFSYLLVSTLHTANILLFVHNCKSHWHAPCLKNNLLVNGDI